MLVPGDLTEINCVFAVLGVLPFLAILGTQVSLWALAIFMDSSMSPPKIEAQNLRPALTVHVQYHACILICHLNKMRFFSPLNDQYSIFY